MAVQHGRRSGEVREADFMMAWYLDQLKPVVAQVRSKIPGWDFDEGKLGNVSAKLLQFMETVLGKNAKGPKAFPKLPAKLLWDFSENGPLYWLGLVCADFERNRDWMADDFRSREEFPRRQCLEFVKAVRSHWEDKGFLKPFHIYIDEACGNDIPRLQDIANELGATLASAADEAGVTHHVVPFGPDGDPDDGNQYLRTLAIQGNQSRVHWWYHPDSYDEWMPKTSAPENLDPDKEAPKPWRVYARFLYDSEQYNEWMNPVDYEVEGSDDGGKGGKRDAEDAAGADAKKSRVEEPELPEVMPGTGHRVAKGVVRRTVGKPYARAMDGSATAQNLSQGHHNPEPKGVDPLAKSGPVFPAPVTASRCRGEQQPRQNSQEPDMVEVYRVPAHASWFKWNHIHDLERRGVPEFFNGRSDSKTPKVYKEMRDFIMNLFRKDKSRKLTFTECRKMLSGDVNAVHRVWSFLDHWGLINFMPESAPLDGQKPSETLPVVQAEGMPPGVRVVSAPPAPENLFAFSKSTPASAGKAAALGGNVLSILTRKDTFGISAVSTAPGCPPQYVCNADTSHDCTAVRYHCTTIPDIDICPKCYADGRLPNGMTSKDFIRIDNLSEDGDPSSDWTDQETLLLLEALEVYGDNWVDVAEHVGTKNQVQCITHFLQMPIEDQFLNEMGRSTPGCAIPEPNAASEDGPAYDGEALPFADAGNPIMAQVAFLAAMIGPRVAAAAAQAALQALAEDEPAVAAEAAAAVAEAQTTEAPTGHGSVTVEGSANGGNPATTEGAKPMEVDSTDLPGPSSTAAEGPAAVPVPIADEGSRPLSPTRLQAAAAIGMAAAAVKAKLLADQEEREIQRLVVGVVQNQAEKLELKLKHFEDLESALERERAALESSWASLFVERAELSESQAAAAKAPQPTTDTPGPQSSVQTPGPAGHTGGGHQTPANRSLPSFSVEGITPASAVQPVQAPGSTLAPHSKPPTTPMTAQGAKDTPSAAPGTAPSQTPGV